MRNLIIEAEQSPVDILIKNLERDRDAKLAATDDKDEKEGIKNLYKKKIETIKAKDKVEQALQKQKDLEKEYEDEKQKAGNDEGKLAKLKEKFEKKLNDAQTKVDDERENLRKVRGMSKPNNVITHNNDNTGNETGYNTTNTIKQKPGDSAIPHKNDKKSDLGKFAKYGGDIDLDDDSILDNKDINKDDKTEKDVNRFFEKAKEHKDMGKCLDDMPWGVIACAAIFCPPAAIAIGGLTLLPGIINTVMLGLGALKEAKDETAKVCDKIAGGVKKAVNKIKGKSGDDSDIIDAQLDDVINSTTDRNGNLKPTIMMKNDLKHTPTGKALEARENTVKQLEAGEIDKKVAEAEMERNDLNLKKSNELANAKDDKEKEEIENKYKELIAQADEKVEAAKNGETLSTEEVVDKETGKKVKATVHTGPRGGKYYYPKGAPHNDEHKRYLTDSKSFEYYLNMVMESSR